MAAVQSRKIGAALVTAIASREEGRVRVVVTSEDQAGVRTHSHTTWAYGESSELRAADEALRDIAAEHSHALRVGGGE